LPTIPSGAGPAADPTTGGNGEKVNICRFHDGGREERTNEILGLVERKTTGVVRATSVLEERDRSLSDLLSNGGTVLAGDVAGEVDIG
jgi:hypothetical protein